MERKNIDHTKCYGTGPQRASQPATEPSRHLQPEAMRGLQQHQGPATQFGVKNRSCVTTNKMIGQMLKQLWSDGGGVGVKFLSLIN